MAEGGVRSNNVRVVCRFRPRNGREEALLDGKPGALDNTPNQLQIMPGESSVRVGGHTASSTKSLNFTFDAVYDGSSTQEQVYIGAAQPAVAQLFEGYNATIFAYGQTGAGKTWTMLGNNENPGVIPRAINQVTG